METLRLGIDVGSTTVKLAVLDADGSLVFGRYARHFSDVAVALEEMLREADKVVGGAVVVPMITGSGGLTISGRVGVPFIQEVVAVAAAIRRDIPDCDAAIEIGGEDAKILYFRGGTESRMNGVCAGGTGSFIDQMASLLRTDAAGLNELAKAHTFIYPIAARCGVFAKSDIQPLINEGAPRADLAASVFQAVVAQTISGLACGRPIRGRVAFLGGPLHFLSELRARFASVLNLAPEDAIMPENSHLFAAFGAALSAGGARRRIADIIHELKSDKAADFEIARLAPLFADEDEYIKFKERHARASLPKRPLAGYGGGAFLGIDAGSTTTKMALITPDGELLHSFYASNAASPLEVAREALLELYAAISGGVTILGSCVTGYGEGLLKAGLGVDHGEIETVAHMKAAVFFEPEADFILDIGGQDMKCLRLKDGVIDSVLLNEACSAGCGSFIETFARALGQTPERFARTAMDGRHPIDLGSRCTVFMNSRVKQAQKEGASVGDISAGLAYSVVRNALQKVIKITDPKRMGRKLVVQGGTFLGDAVLRAFELISGREAVRPDAAGLMGAFGAALIARERWRAGSVSAIAGADALRSMMYSASMSRCRGCENNCMLTVNRFSGGSRFISGNRCERGAGGSKNASDLPNLYEYKLKRLFAYKPISGDDAPRGRIGVPRVLNMYENYPLWFTFLTRLGFRAELSPVSTRRLYEKGIESMPSESVCYPAKLAHGHIMALIESGAPAIFYPSAAYERKEFARADECYNCPIVATYPENIRNNVEEIRGVNFISPFVNLNDERSAASALARAFPDIPPDEIAEALAAGFAEAETFRADVRRAGEEALEYIEKRGARGIVLAGRPYHADPEVNHGIAEMINAYGVAVLTEDSVAHLGEPLLPRPVGVRDQWAYHSRLYAAAAFARSRRDLELIQLNSFGCGLDAVTTDETQAIMSRAGKIYTMIKIDEVNNLGSARIRVRSLLAAVRARAESPDAEIVPPPERVVFTKKMRKEHTILCPQMSPTHFELLTEAFRAGGYNLVAMPATDRGAVDVGLRYVNNDACYPALIVVGQLIKAIEDGGYDPDRVSLMITQTGGGCRASNYIGFIRKALEKAGLSRIAVVSLSMGGLEKNPGLALTPALISRAAKALVMGDLLSALLYRVRPYERDKGAADALFGKWLDEMKRAVRGGGYKRAIYGAVAEFDALPLVVASKPRVGVVGEILVKFHPTANNDLVSLLESEGAEAVVPDLTGFILYSLYNANFKRDNYGASVIGAAVSNAAIAAIEFYRRHARDAMRISERFTPPPTIRQLAEYAEPILSLGNQSGEGWFLTAEMVELIHSGAPNIICAQPFACLPNHVTGKGMIKELKRRFPSANIVAIDYDPGASEVNQLNRIKLMLAAASNRNQTTENRNRRTDAGRQKAAAR
ncbi:MAG: 2-hydroxyacyl-CoA dehydratase [Clostridiales bacterium]|jgi:predicted CoA-substrate-specific enzyme activase|nr:2-hydroxyacyl-CoA dehydratase [Clostridiales bacterium]